MTWLYKKYKSIIGDVQGCIIIIMGVSVYMGACMKGGKLSFM